MKNIFLISIGLLSLFIACKSAEIMLDPSMRAKEMPVKGRQGWQINQTIKFGEFSTDKIKRGWTHSYDIPFFVRFTGASEKLSYNQYDGKSNSAKVACAGKLRSREIELIGDYFTIPLKYENYFAGSVILSTDSSYWDFIIHNPSGDFMRERSSAGFVTNGKTRIEIDAIRGMKGQPSWLQNMAIHGFHFYLDGKTIGAVSTINKGKVWIVKDIKDDLRLLLASVSTGILLRRDLEDVEN